MRLYSKTTSLDPRIEYNQYSKLVLQWTTNRFINKKQTITHRSGNIVDYVTNIVVLFHIQHGLVVIVL